MNIILGVCAGATIMHGFIDEKPLLIIAGIAVFAVAIALVW